MRWTTPSLLGLCSLIFAFSCPACKGWRPQQSHDVVGLSDPNATYSAVLATLRAQKYTVIDQNVAAHAVRVKSHVDESEPSHLSRISLQVDGSAVHMSASGYLVHADGSTHHSLNTELSTLQKQLQKQIAGSAPSAPSVNAAAAPASPLGSLPTSWSEPAYDPSVWGRGNFTCLPVKLAADEKDQLTLELSNGDTADALLSLAYAPELCRAPGSCKLAGGCPALGIGDSDRVSKLAGRLSSHEIGPLATLYSHGRPVAVIDLSKHGSIAEAMTQAKH